MAGTISKSLDVKDVCPTEDVISILLEYLVDPKLPPASSSRAVLSQCDQESVAKQVHAVVMLYNYFYRRHHPHLEFMGFEGFCKLAVILRPTLLACMSLMQRSTDCELDDMEKQLSMIERGIMDACDISACLDASKDAPAIDGWPISKVAVLLVDSRREKCLLQFGSIIEGVWSLLERDLDYSSSNLPESTLSSNLVSKKKRIIKKVMKSGSQVDENVLQKLAFSVVRDTTGIDQPDLMILESHIVYSISKEKTVACFYIMQCVQSRKNDIFPIDIMYAINSLCSPLVIKSCSRWTHSTVIEHFQLLPYASIIKEWASSIRLLGSSFDEKGDLGLINHCNSNGNEDPCGYGSSDVGNKRYSSRKSSPNPENGSANDDHSSVNLDVYSRSHEKAIDDYAVICLEDEKRERVVATKGKPENHGENVAFTEGGLGGSTIGDQVMSFEELQNINKCDCRETDKQKNNSISSNQDGYALINSKSNSTYLEKLHAVLTLNEKELSQAALKAILRRRDKLSFQQRDIEDQIAQCDKDIQTILKGDEDDLALKLDHLIKGCNDACLRSAICTHDEGHCSSMYAKRKRQHGSLDVGCSCQALDEVCCENNWILPTYHVSAIDSGFQATVIVKGPDFGHSSKGALSSSPAQARQTAAANMISQLQVRH